MLGHITTSPLDTFFEIKCSGWLFCHFCALFCGRFVWFVMVNVSLTLPISRQWLLMWTGRNRKHFQKRLSILRYLYVQRSDDLRSDTWYFFKTWLLYVRNWCMVSIGTVLEMKRWVVGFSSPVSVTDNLKFHPSGPVTLSSVVKHELALLGA